MPSTRLRQLRLLASERGRELLTPTHPGTLPRRVPAKRKPQRSAGRGSPRPESGLRPEGDSTVGSEGGTEAGRKAKLAVDIPDYRWVEELNVEDRLLATYDAIGNVVLLRVDHPVIQNVISCRGAAPERLRLRSRQGSDDQYDDEYGEAHSASIPRRLSPV